MTALSPYDENDLLISIANGNEGAFRKLYNQYRAKVYTIAIRITGIESAAEDVVQEVFIKVWVNRDKLPGMENFSGWLNTITRHHIYNSLRKLASEEQFLRHLLAQKPGAADSLEALAYKELHALLNKAINELTPQQKKVYLLSRVEGLSHAQIGEQLGLATETVKGYMKDSLRSIRSFLNKNERLFTALVIMLFQQRW